MRPVAPVMDDVAADNRRRAVRSEVPLANRRSVVQPRMPAIPPPPRLPAEAEEMLSEVLARGEGAWSKSSGPPSHLDAIIAETLGETVMPAPWDDATRAIVGDLIVEAAMASDRVTELQSRGSELLEEAMAARRERDRARIEADALWSRCLMFEAMLRRIDPTWKGP